VFSWDENTVLKLYHPRIPEMWIEQERKVGRFVWEAALPVPAMQGTVREADRIGLLWERVRGASLLSAIVRQPLRLRAHAEAFVSLQGRIRGVEAADLPPIEVWLDQIIRHSPFLSPAEKQALVARVEALPAGNRLLHMDFHPGNVLQGGHDGYKVIDWLMAMRGPAEADVARTCLLLEHHLRPAGMGRFKSWLVRRLLSEFKVRYLELSVSQYGMDAQAIDQWLVPLAAARLAEPVSHEERMSLSQFVRPRILEGGC
jgi:aminoglycoside phosphotransferase (APT) family kinase protein